MVDSLEKNTDKDSYPLNELTEKMVNMYSNPLFIDQPNWLKMIYESTDYFTKNEDEKLRINKIILHLTTKVSEVKYETNEVVHPYDYVNSTGIQESIYFMSEGKVIKEQRILTNEKSSEVGYNKSIVHFDHDGSEYINQYYLIDEKIKEHQNYKTISYFDNEENAIIKQNYLTNKKIEELGYNVSTTLYDQNGIAVLTEVLFIENFAGNYKGVMFYRKDGSIETKERIFSEEQAEKEGTVRAIEYISSKGQTMAERRIFSVNESKQYGTLSSKMFFDEIGRKLLVEAVLAPQRAEEEGCRIVRNYFDTSGNIAKTEKLNEDRGIIANDLKGYDNMYSDYANNKNQKGQHEKSIVIALIVIVFTAVFLVLTFR